MPIIVSDNVERECSNLISLYKDVEFIKKILLVNYPNLSREKQKSIPIKIKAHIVQGMEFLSRTDEGIVVSPLSLFYSIYNFAKAIFYINRPNETIASSHGLELIKESVEKADGIGDVSIRALKSGTFASLVNISKDEISTEELVRAKDAFSVIPELCEVYALRYSEEPNVFLLREKKGSPNSYEILHQTEQWFDKKDFTFVTTKKIHIQHSVWNTSLYLTEACQENDLDSVTYRDVHGNRYLTCGICGEKKPYRLSRVVSLYICYYIFGMLSRYYPEKWMSICDSADSALIQKLVADSRREMLIEVLRLLSGKEYMFVTKLQAIEPELDIKELWDKLEKELKLQKRISGHSPLRSLL